MALKHLIQNLVEVPGPLREHYVKAEDGTFVLAVEGHPDAAKVAEFRTSAIEARKERDALKAQFEGIDPAAVKADRLRLTEFEKAKPAERVTQLEAELAAEKAARSEAQQKADRSRVRDVLRVKATAAGVLPAALDIFLDKATAIFTMKGDVVQAHAGTFSPTRPGELLTPDEWVATATKEFSFLFAPSKGGGATGSSGSGVSNVRELRDPTPQQLGQFAREIAAGELRVVHS